MSDQKTRREAIYDEKIESLMAQIIQVCQDHDIPFVASFQLSDNIPPEATPQQVVEGGFFCTSAKLEPGTHPALADALEIIRGPQPRTFAFTIHPVKPS